MGLMDKLKGMMGGKKADSDAEEAAERLRRKAQEAPVPAPPPRPAPEAVVTPPPPEPEAAPAVDPLEAMMPAEDPLETLRKTFRENQQDAETGIKLAKTLHKAGQTAEAAGVLHQVAQVLTDQEPDKAIEAYKTIKQMGEGDAQTSLFLAELYKSLGRLKDAELEYRGVLRHDMNNLQALTQIADLALQQGNPKDALLVCNKLLQINPRDPLAREKLGDIHLAGGDKPEAVKAWLMAAHEYVVMQDKPAARSLYQRIVEADPTNTTAQRELANLT